jgi:hypothetical protein
MIASRVAFLFVILILSLWQTLFAGGSSGELALDQSVTRATKGGT